jgi:hypothetical protein
VNYALTINAYRTGNTQIILQKMQAKAKQQESGYYLDLYSKKSGKVKFIIRHLLLIQLEKFKTRYRKMFLFYPYETGVTIMCKITVYLMRQVWLDLSIYLLMTCGFQEPYVL